MKCNSGRISTRQKERRRDPVQRELLNAAERARYHGRRRARAQVVVVVATTQDELSGWVQLPGGAWCEQDCVADVLGMNPAAAAKASGYELAPGSAWE